MKIIFLDIDGVLNTALTCALPQVFVQASPELEQTRFNQFKKECVERLNEITDATNAKLIISSTWRIGCVIYGTMDNLRLHLKDQGVKAEVIGNTPLDNEINSDGVRGVEIQWWLDNNEEVESFIILDDSSDMVHLMPKLVHIKNGWMGGIQPEHVDDAIKRLT